MNSFAQQIYYDCKVVLVHTSDKQSLQLKDNILSDLTQFPRVKCTQYEVSTTWEIPFVIAKIHKPNFHYTLPIAYIVVGPIDRSTDAYCSIYDALMKCQMDHAVVVINGLWEENPAYSVDLVNGLLQGLVTRNKINDDQKFNR